MFAVRNSSIKKWGGFSLIEVTLALGVIAFALVAIMGLFPVAMKSATESQRETRATFVAQSIFADIASGASPTNSFIAIGTNFQQPAGRLVVNLQTSGTNYLVFSDEGVPLGSVTAAEFSNPVAVSSSAYGARVIIDRDAFSTNLTRVEVQVEAPVTTGSGNRTKYNFVTKVRNR